jgi:hypothetical protein
MEQLTEVAPEKKKRQVTRDPAAVQGADTARLGDYSADLACKLTQVELLERGQKLAQVHEDLATHEAHAQNVKQELKAAEARLLDEGARLASIVRGKMEPRSVKVECWADYSRGVYYERRTDTGEVIPGSERPLRPEERQGVLRLDVKAKALSPSLDEQKAARQKDLEQRADSLLAKGKERSARGASVEDEDEEGP